MRSSLLRYSEVIFRSDAPFCGGGGVRIGSGMTFSGGRRICLCPHPVLHRNGRIVIRPCGFRCFCLRSRFRLGGISLGLFAPLDFPCGGEFRPLQVSEGFGGFGYCLGIF